MPEYTDDQRSEFIELLDKAADDGVEVTDWEAKFMASNMQRRTFTDGQRNVIDDMIRKYGDQVKDW